MRFFVATLFATASFLSPPISGFAESADVEAMIKAVDTANLSLTLDDGKTYQAPEEFNFEGLKAGVKVLSSIPKSTANGSSTTSKSCSDHLALKGSQPSRSVVPPYSIFRIRSCGISPSAASCLAVRDHLEQRADDAAMVTQTVGRSRSSSQEPMRQDRIS